MAKAKQQGDVYQRMRRELRQWTKSRGRGTEFAEFALLAPDFLHLIVKLVADPKVPRREKATLGIAVAYFVSPYDLIPERLVGPIGYIDDVVVGAYALNRLINETSEATVRRHWAGDQDLLDSIREILARADRMVGMERLKSIRGLLEGPPAPARKKAKRSTAKKATRTTGKKTKRAAVGKAKRATARKAGRPAAKKAGRASTGTRKKAAARGRPASTRKSTAKRKRG